MLMQNIIVFILVSLSFLYLVYHFYRQFSVKSGCGSACKNCTVNIKWDEIADNKTEIKS
jgi:hypothetical protein